MTLVVFVMLFTTIYACEASATHSTVSKWIVARDHEEVARRKSDQLLLAMIVAISSPPWTSKSSQSPTQYQSHTEGRYSPNYAPLTKRSEPSSSRPQAGSRRGLSSSQGSDDRSTCHTDRCGAFVMVMLSCIGTTSTAINRDCGIRIRPPGPDISLP